MKTITKHYSGAQDGYLYPREQEIGGVAGDSNACKIIFKIPKNYEEGWNKLIVFDGEIYDKTTHEFIPMEYPLASDNSFTIPAEISDQYRGKVISYHLVLAEIATDTVITSQPAALYFSKSAKNINVTTFLATHAIVDADFTIDKSPGVDRGCLRLFRPEGNPNITLKLDVPYLEDGKIPKQFIDAGDYKVNVFEIENPSELIGLSDATKGDWAIIKANNKFNGNLYLLLGDYNVESDWATVLADEMIFSDIVANGITALTGLTLDGVSNKVLITNEDGEVVASVTTPLELSKLHGIKPGETIQEQFDGKLNILSKAFGDKDYEFPYHFETPVQYSDSIYAIFHTIELNDQTKKYDRSITIPAADVNNDKAGLYTKAQNDAIIDSINAEAIQRAEADSALQGKIEAESSRAQTKEASIASDLASEVDRAKVAEGSLDSKIDDETARATSVEDTKLNIPGNAPIAPHEILRLPYFFEQEVLANKIVVKSHNIKLDNDPNKTDEVFSIDVNLADISNDKAGLYSKALADVKADKTALDDEISARGDADTVLQTNIDAEVSRAKTKEAELDDRITTISIRGRFLSLWDSTTGKPLDEPKTSPYPYKAGDYYIVSKVGIENLRPDGTQYVVGQAGSTVKETGLVAVNDIYIYSTTNWVLEHLEDRVVSFNSIAGEPRDNIKLAEEFDKQIHLLGAEEGSGQPYHFPYNFNALIQNSDNISTTFDTITLDNNKTKVSYPISIPAADPTNNKAGLLTKALYDSKADVSALADEVTRATGAESALTTAINTEKTRAEGAEGTLTTNLANEVTRATGAENTLQTNINNEATARSNADTILEESKTNRMVQISNGKSYISNLAGDAGSVMKFEHADGTWSGIGVNNGGKDDGISAQIYAVNGTSKTGTRINVTQNAIYYTKGKSSAVFDVGNEIATIEDVKVYGADFVGSVNTHDDLKTLRTKTTEEGIVPIDKNDFAVVLDDTLPSGEHARECWRYRCTNPNKVGTLDAWTAEYSISNVPFTPEQWLAVNSGATKTKIDSIADKVESSIYTVGTGVSLIFNEADGGGAKFEHTDGTNSFIGVNNGGKDGISGQLYVVDKTDATKGCKINLEKGMFTYIKDKATSLRTVDDEIAVKGDIKAQIAPQTATITTGGWGSAATGDLFVKNITITGIKSTDYPIVGTAFDADTAAEIEAQQEAAAHIVKAAAYDGGITFYADEAPAVDIPIIVRSM